MQPIKITAKMLTNEALVAIVDAVIEARILPDDLILKYYNHGLVTQVGSIQRQLENIQKKAKNKKLSRKDAIALSEEMPLWTIASAWFAHVLATDHAFSMRISSSFYKHFPGIPRYQRTVQPDGTFIMQRMPPKLRLVEANKEVH